MPIVIAVMVWGASPAFSQSAGVASQQTAPRTSFSEFWSRFSRPQTVEPAPPVQYVRRQAVQRTVRRARVSRVRKPIEESAPVRPEPIMQEPVVQETVQREPETPAWPVAETNLGVSGIVPVEIRTVREMVEAEPEAPLVRDNELSDLDIAAPSVVHGREVVHAREVTLTTDGRASVEEDPPAQRFAAMVENLKMAGGISWLEPVLLVMAGAGAAVAAMRIFWQRA